ncbi:MAG TPA: nucleoside triphosphate pyrophosphohydrolase [Candidatus Binataceae bacterium]|nr:nucleoside triphosphate pyrophosphohydrolase [Candidatus Binataceae bacterium]
MGDAPTRKAAQEFLALLKVVRELRRKCPWDREQTLASSSRHLLEEAYETVGAIEDGSDRELIDELGDLLVQVLFAANIAEEADRLSIAAMLVHARDKLVRRHPHVYAGAPAASADEVIARWNQLKRDERAAAGAQSALEGVARALPALTRAQKLGARAREAGMDWPDAAAVLDKVAEELQEARAALERGEREGAAEELGDALLALANAPRFIGHDAEATLRRACDKFVERFKTVERIAAERKLALPALAPDEMERLWQEAKRRARGGAAD